MYLDLERESNTEIKKTKKIPKKELNYLRKEKLNAKINKRASQLRYRLEEGHGKAIYIIGIRDDGTVEGIEIELLFKSLNFLYKMVDIINAIIKNIRIYKSNNQNKFIFTARIEIPNYTPKQLLSI
jgi:GTPase